MSQNQTVSNIIESLLAEATPRHLLHFMNALAKDWETAFTDRFASHVTQTLLLHVMPHMNRTVNDLLDKEQGHNSESDDDEFSNDTGVRSMKSLFVELYSMLMSNLTLFMQHTYASHILRVVMEVLAGTTVSASIIKSKLSRHHRKGQWHILE